MPLCGHSEGNSRRRAVKLTSHGVGVGDRTRRRGCTLAFRLHLAADRSLGIAKEVLPCFRRDLRLRPRC